MPGDATGTVSLLAGRSLAPTLGPAGRARHDGTRGARVGEYRVCRAPRAAPARQLALDHGRARPLSHGPPASAIQRVAQRHAVRADGAHDILRPDGLTLRGSGPPPQREHAAALAPGAYVDRKCDPRGGGIAPRGSHLRS